MGMSPAQREARSFVQVGGRTNPRPRDAGKAAAGPIKPPRDLPPFPFFGQTAQC